MKQRCAVYARYSSDRQSPTSIEDQIRKCCEFAAREGYHLEEEHIYSDEALSGSGADRPGLQLLMRAIRRVPRQFDVVLVDDTSRLARDLVQMKLLSRELEFLGLRMVSVSQGIDTGQEQSQVLITVHGLVDELYTKELAKKTHRGLEGAVLRGHHAGGRCFGYRNEVTATGVHLRIDEREAAVVRRIFEMCANGASIKRIARTLNNEHVPPPRPRPGRIASWCPTAIREMLYNER
jgi:site-specific DNA recombinase